jgi:hypothetical protein
MPEEEGHTSIDIEKAAKGLVRFYDGDLSQTEEAINRFLGENPMASKAELFRSLSEKKGKGKAHAGAMGNSEEKRDGFNRHIGRRRSNRGH